MRFNKIIKRICAVGVGAAMVGATISGAFAADLSAYPSMFIKNGNFDGMLVVGKNADAIDTLGITNIAMALQAASVTATNVCSSTATSSTTGENVKLRAGSNGNFEIWSSLNYAFPKASDADLPHMLADGNYVDNVGDNKQKTEYSQYINFPDPGTANFISTEDDDYAPQAGPYLFFPKAKTAYQYVLKFNSDVDFANGADLEGTSIVMQGQAFSITGASVDGTNKLSKMNLLVGQDARWMKEGETETRIEGGQTHTIKMTDVNVDENACGFEIDGNTLWINKDNEEKVGVISVGVLDVKSIHSEKYDQDLCKVNFGVSEYTLEQGAEVKKNGVAIRGSLAEFNVSTTLAAGKWGGLSIKWLPYNDTYVSPDPSIIPNELADPVFGLFKFRFEKAVANDDMLQLTTTTNKGEIKFPSSDGKDIAIPVYPSDDNTTVSGVDSVGLGTTSDINKRYYYNASLGLDKSTCAPTTAAFFA